MELTEYSRDEISVHLHTTMGRMKLMASTDGIVRIQYTLMDDFSTKESLMLADESSRS